MRLTVAGQTISTIAKSLNLDRKTVCRYIKSAQKAGIARDADLPGEAGLLAQLQALSKSGDRQKPATGQFEPYWEELLALVADPQDPLTFMVWLAGPHPSPSGNYRNLQLSSLNSHLMKIL